MARIQPLERVGGSNLVETAMTNSPLFSTGDEATTQANKEAWVYLEMLKSAVGDCARAIAMGLVDEKTLQPAEQQRLMLADMVELVAGANFLLSQTCKDLCSYITLWSGGKIRMTQNCYIKLAKAEAKKRKRTNKKYNGQSKRKLRCAV